MILKSLMVIVTFVSFSITVLSELIFTMGSATFAVLLACNCFFMLGVLQLFNAIKKLFMPKVFKFGIDRCH